MGKRPARKKPTKGPNVVPSMKAVAAHFGVSYGTVRHDWKNAGMPVTKDGKYDVDAIAEWRALRNGGRTNGSAAGSADPILLERKALENQLKKEELIAKQRENQIKAGGLISHESAMKFYAAAYTWLREDLERIPLDMETAFPADLRRELCDLLRERIHLTLKMFMRQQSKLAKLARVD